MNAYSNFSYESLRTTSRESLAADSAVMSLFALSKRIADFSDDFLMQKHYFYNKMYIVIVEN